MIRVAHLTAAVVCALALTAPLKAQQARYGPMPKHWSAKLSTPQGWYRQALCIHGREGAWNADTGNGYYGGFQFLIGTWRSVGGPSYPHLVSPREQLYRAWLVWRRDGGSWREWGTAWAC